MKLDLPVMVSALAAAAAVQEFLPCVPCGPVGLKVRFLPAVAVYYAFSRQWQLSLCAALWAGILTAALSVDALSAPTVFLAWALVVLVFRDPPVASQAPGAPTVFMRALAVHAFLFAVSTVLLAWRQPDLLPARGADPVMRILWMEFLRVIPLSALAAVPVCALLRRIDLLAENISPHKGGEEP